MEWCKHGADGRMMGNGHMEYESRHERKDGSMEGGMEA